MKIAFITTLFPPDPGGMERWNLQMAEAYAAAGHQVTVYHFRKGRGTLESASFSYRSCPIYPYLDPLNSPAKRNTVDSIVRTLGHFLRIAPGLRRYDLWQVSFGEPELLKMLVFGLGIIFRKRVISGVGCRTFGHRFPSALHRGIVCLTMKSMFARSTAILVDGRDILRELSANGVDAKKISVCYAGADTRLFKPTGTREELAGALKRDGLDFPAPAPMVLFCGRFSYENAPLDFITVMAGLSGINALMIGDGPQRAEVEKKAAGLAVPVRFAGSLPYERLPLYFSHADVCLFPLSTHIGGISQVVPLAMACGGIVVTQDIGDNNALIVDGKNGFLASGIDALRRVVTQVLEGKVSTGELRNNARETIVRSWSLEARRKEYALLLDGLRQEKDRH